MKAISNIIKEASRKLRKNMTEAEKILWKELRAKRLN
jgi:very-short-patch-repair endonuclease